MQVSPVQFSSRRLNRYLFAPIVAVTAIAAGCDKPVNTVSTAPTTPVAAKQPPPPPKAKFLTPTEIKEIHMDGEKAITVPASKQEAFNKELLKMADQKNWADISVLKDWKLTTKGRPALVREKPVQVGSQKVDITFMPVLHDGVSEKSKPALAIFTLPPSDPKKAPIALYIQYQGQVPESIQLKLPADDKRGGYNKIRDLFSVPVRDALFPN